MQTITMLGMKGGTGRTTLTMALAMAFVAKGQRVLIVDGAGDRKEGGQFEVSAMLQQWRKTLLEDGLPEEALELGTFDTDVDLDDLLTRALRRGTEVALFDTSSRSDGRLRACLELATLALVPFSNLSEAKSALVDVDFPDPSILLLGVANALSAPVPSREEMTKALGMPVLWTTLPHDELLRELPNRGRIDRFVADIDESGRNLRAKLRMRDAWYRVLALSMEIEWLMEGQTLRECDWKLLEAHRLVPKPRKTPPEASAPAEPSMASTP